eukprot:XP_017945022.1 PREDICTED: putative olfactory receptor 13C6 [Xenopus tropicalis]
MGNCSEPTEFILLGLSSNPSVQTLLFCLFLTIYVSSLVANGLLIMAVKRDGHLHSSMYFFLANLSIMDICYTSVIVPKALVNFLGGKKSISYNGCVLQIFFYLFLGESECILLAFMAYDRYIAICSPLSYSTVLSTAVCARMISASCAEITYIGKGATQAFECNGMVGRFVTIVIPGRQTYLQMCEVQVYGEPLSANKCAPN